MLFGLNRQTDEQSIRELLEHVAQREVTEVLLPRMSDEEMTRLADLLMDLVRTHLSHAEYHRLLLKDGHHSH